MKTILYISILSLFFMGCGQITEPQPNNDYIYIKNKCPDLTILRPIPKKYRNIKKIKVTFEKTDDPKKVIVLKDVLKQGSINSYRKDLLIQKQDKYIRFYEKEIREYLRFKKELEQ